VAETQTSQDYQGLILKWSDRLDYAKLVENWKSGEDYGRENDFDGSLNDLIKLVVELDKSRQISSKVEAERAV
jgi:hypothetical protein